MYGHIHFYYDNSKGTFKIMFQSLKNKKESRCNSDHMKIQFSQKTFLSKYSLIKRQFYQKTVCNTLFRLLWLGNVYMTCMLQTFISRVNITYPEVTQVHKGWMKCCLMFTSPLMKH